MTRKRAVSNNSSSPSHVSVTDESGTVDGDAAQDLPDNVDDLNDEINNIDEVEENNNYNNGDSAKENQSISVAITTNPAPNIQPRSSNKQQAAVKKSSRNNIKNLGNNIKNYPPKIIRLDPETIDQQKLLAGTKKHSLLVSVPEDKVGLIIGKGGLTVKGIQLKHRCEVEIPPGADKDNPSVRTLTILASDIGDCERGRNEILAVCTGTQGHLPAIAPPGHVQTFCTIPNDKVGSVIGKGGANVKQLMMTTGCKIIIPGVPDASSINTGMVTRTLTLVGPPMSIQPTIEGITQLVHRQPQSNQPIIMPQQSPMNQYQGQPVQMQGFVPPQSNQPIIMPQQSQMNQYQSQPVQMHGFIPPQLNQPIIMPQQSQMNQYPRQPVQMQGFVPSNNTNAQPTMSYNASYDLSPTGYSTPNQNINHLIGGSFMQQPHQPALAPVQAIFQPYSSKSSSRGAQYQPQQPAKVAKTSHEASSSSGEYKYTRSQWQQWKLYYRSQGKDLQEEAPENLRAPNYFQS